MLPPHLTHYQTWEKSVFLRIREESVWQFFAYRKSLFLYELCWHDCEMLLKDYRGRQIANQLIRSMGSVCANIEEGYGRGLHSKSYLQFLRYSIASAKETKGWYYRSRYLLSNSLVKQRLELISEIIALTIVELNRKKV